jgi:hypothetical protein
LAKALKIKAMQLNVTPTNHKMGQAKINFQLCVMPSANITTMMAVTVKMAL